MAENISIEKGKALLPENVKLPLNSINRQVKTIDLENHDAPLDIMPVQQDVYTIVEADENNDIQLVKYVHDDAIDETQPLLGTGSRKENIKRTKSLLITLAIILLIALAYAAGCVVYELKIFVDNDDSTSNTLAIQGEYVELPYYIMNTIMMYKYILQFYLPNNSGELLPHPEVDIFEIKCDKLLDEANRTEHFHRLHPSSPSPSLIPLILTRRYFDDCLPYKQKCILGEYFYQAKSPWSELNFNITINNFTDTTNVLIVAYDNYEYYLDFLLGEGHSKAVESQTMDAENYLFIFNNDQMKLSSYYFFAIQDIEGSVEWFTADRYGCHVYYNASSLTPHCTMNATNNYTCAVHGVHDNDYCFLGHVRGDEIDGMPTKSQIFNITQWVDEPLPTIEGQISVITVGGIIVGLSIVVILFIWLYYYIKTKQCCCT